MGIMEKNKILLFGVSDLFTEETLEHILRKVSCEKKVEILSWNFGVGSSKGDAYLSVVNRIKVKGIAGSSPTEISLVVKSMPRNLGRRKMLRSTDFFRNEITFHLEIYPKFQNFLKSKDMSDFIILPRWLAAVMDGLNDFLVMEDVSIIGFSPVTRQKTLNLSQCSLILKALARFQSILLHVAEDALTQEYPGSEGENHIALMLDFQLARCASPVLDTSFLIYTCTDKTLRDQHYEDLLRLYHDELSKNISLLGSVLKKPWDIFVNKVQELTVHGINAAIEAVPSAMLDSSEVFDLDVSQGDESVDIAEIFSLKPIRTKEGMHRLADVILHAVEKRYL